MVRKVGFNWLKNEADTLSPPNRRMTIQLGSALHSQSYKPEELGFPNLSEKNTGADIPAYFIHAKTPTGEIKSYLCVNIKQCLTKYDDLHNQILSKPKFNFLERAALNVAIQGGDFEEGFPVDLKETTLSNQSIGEYSISIDQGGNSSTSINDSELPKSPTGSSFDPFHF